MHSTHIQHLFLKVHFVTKKKGVEWSVCSGDAFSRVMNHAFPSKILMDESGI